MPKTLSSSLCSQNVSFLVKIEGSFDENKLEKSHKKHRSLQKKTKIGHSVLGLILRQKLFILKNLTMPKTVKGGLSDFLTSILLQNFKKNRMGTLETLETFRKKNKN